MYRLSAVLLGELSTVIRTACLQIKIGMWTTAYLMLYSLAQRARYKLW